MNHGYEPVSSRDSNPTDLNPRRDSAHCVSGGETVTQFSFRSAIFRDLLSRALRSLIPPRALPEHTQGGGAK